MSLEKIKQKRLEINKEKAIKVITKEFKVDESTLVYQPNTTEIIFKDDKYYYKTMNFLKESDILMSGHNYRQFKNHLAIIKDLEKLHNVDFKGIFKESSKDKVNAKEWLKRFKALKSNHVNTFVIKKNIIRSPIIEGTMLTMDNLNIEKYKEFFNSFLEKDVDDYYLAPSDFIEAVIINKDNEYIIVDHKQIRPYFFDSIKFYLYNMAMPEDNVLVIDKVISKYVDEKAIAKIAKISEYDARIVNRGSDSKYLINKCFDF